MTTSIIQTGPAKCYLSGRTTGIDRHHVLHGRGIKTLAEQDGLWIWLDHGLHMMIHDKGYAVLPGGLKVTDKELQALGQKAYIRNVMEKGFSEEIARDQFLHRYGRFWD